ncbi:MAG TPA: hypothetical protein DCY30_00930 [Acidimicrobiaceae bacterium]|nr:hypothetical protein [Acidimicrobiaceae bacterium]
MRKAAIAVLSSLVASVLFTVASSSSPAFATVPADCANDGMIQVINDIGNTITVYEMDVVADPVNASLTQLYQVNFTGNQQKFNGAGINPDDDIMYGSLKHDDNNDYFVRLGSDGFEYLFQWSGGHNYIAGFDSSGTYWYFRGSNYYTVADADNLPGYATAAAANAAGATDISVVGMAMVTTVGADIAIVEEDGNTYAISVNAADTIVIDNLTTEASTAISAANSGIGAANQWGAAYAFGDLVYVSANDGTGIYQIPWKSYLNGQTTLNVTEVVANSEITNTNDGANCVNAAPPALPCGFPGLGGITADDPACVETTSIDVVDPVACATLGAIQHINTDNGPNGTGGSAPYSHLYTFDVDLVTGNIAPFDPPWGLDLNAHGIEEINATGINPLDDKMYGYAKLIDGGQGVVRFDQYGDLEWVSVGHGLWSIAGGFTPDGTYVTLASTGRSLANLHTYDGWETYEKVTNNGPGNNWITSSSSGIYGNDLAIVTNSDGDVISISVTHPHPHNVHIWNITDDTLAINPIDIPDNGSSLGLGAAFSFVDNSMYVMHNSSQGTYKILWDEPTIDGKVQVVQVMASADTNANDGASCIDEMPPFPCEWDNSLTSDDPNCTPTISYSVDNQMHCIATGHTRSYSITNNSQVAGTVTLTDVDTAATVVKELPLSGTITFTEGVDFSITDDAVNDFTIDIDWLSLDTDTSYGIEIPTTIGNYVDCDPEAYFNWQNLSCPSYANLEWDLSQTIHGADISIQLDGGSFSGTDPIVHTGLTAGQTGTIAIPLEEQTSNAEITASMSITFTNGHTRQMAFTHGTQNCFEAATAITLNHDCVGSSLYINNTGGYDLSLSYTNNGATTEISLAAGTDQTIDLGWTEGSTNSVSFFGSYLNEPDNPPSVVQSTFSNKVVNCQPPTVQVEEGGDSYTFTITPPCSVNDYGVIPVDLDPETPGTQGTDEFTYSIELLENGDLAITVDDVDDLEIDGTTFDDIIVYYSGPDCEPEDCMNGNAGTCQIQIEVEVPDNDDFDGQVNVTIDVTCISASLTVTNDGVADLTLSITNNGTVSTLTLSPDDSETVDLGWAEDSTNTVTYVGMFNGVDGQAEGTFTDVKVDCEPPAVELTEGLDSFTFTITPPCAVNDYGIIPVDTDPDTPGTQVSDEFTYSISLLANGDLEITVDDVDDLEIDGTTFDDITIFYTGPNCEPEDCPSGIAGTCLITVEVLVFDNDNPEEIAATGTAHVRMIGLSILIAMLGYGFLHLAQLYGPALLVRVVQYRKIHNTVRVEGSRKNFKVWKKVRKD